MTELLKKAFEKASQLSPSEQDALASALIEEIEGERLWDVRFEKSQPELSLLADAACEEFRADSSAGTRRNTST
jgi:hypothetical protein